MARWVRRRWWLIAAGVVLVLAAVAVWVTPLRSVAATTCPRCFGLVRVQSGLYAERGLSDDERRRLIELVAEANRRVSDFYQGRKSTPSVLACLDAACYARIGGGAERGIAVLNRAVMLSPRGIDPVIAAHELSHVEFHERLGDHRKQVPQWFDEGLAVLVSNDLRYLLPNTTGDRCRVVPDAELPSSLHAWLTAAGTDQQLYAKAACRVSRWADAHGGNRAVIDLIADLNRGESFAAVFNG